MNTYLIVDENGVVVDTVTGTWNAAADAANYLTRSTRTLHRIERVTELRVAS